MKKLNKIVFTAFIPCFLVFTSAFSLMSDILPGRLTEAAKTLRPLQKPSVIYCFTDDMGFSFLTVEFFEDDSVYAYIYIDGPEGKAEFSYVGMFTGMSERGMHLEMHPDYSPEESLFWVIDENGIDVDGYYMNNSACG